MWLVKGHYRLSGPTARLVVGLVVIYSVRAMEVAHLDLADPHLTHRTLAVRRGKRIHTVYLNALRGGPWRVRPLA
ncbi:hypothetical protein [Streptomyces resistomycificus]|uniref:Tyr recombinase domain-containing protein n=1 Tax=Streptomyces resistomycificus TaxID=67356 RepID=A0A0L8L487_9ACTN|nr:hypothetical protein [Streptomyces resistomycificus]KOG33028.1 hypothetical protein ADK37_24405 [Streptomyces resistomycificus]KUN94370.1 hypothetical protein AQJ84_27205 [Streptomyces resistomycificus]